MSPNTLSNFYQCTVEIRLTGCNTPALVTNIPEQCLVQKVETLPSPWRLLTFSTLKESIKVPPQNGNQYYQRSTPPRSSSHLVVTIGKKCIGAWKRCPSVLRTASSQQPWVSWTLHTNHYLTSYDLWTSINSSGLSRTQGIRQNKWLLPMLNAKPVFIWKTDLGAQAKETAQCIIGRQAQATFESKT